MLGAVSSKHGLEGKQVERLRIHGRCWAEYDMCIAPTDATISNWRNGRKCFAGKESFVLQHDLG